MPLSRYVNQLLGGTTPCQDTDLGHHGDSSESQPLGHQGWLGEHLASQIQGHARRPEGGADGHRMDSARSGVKESVCCSCPRGLGYSGCFKGLKLPKVINGSTNCLWDSSPTFLAQTHFPADPSHSLSPQSHNFSILKMQVSITRHLQLHTPTRCPLTCSPLLQDSSSGHCFTEACG